MFGSSYGPPRITYEPLEGEAQDESESDMLPFAIDGDLAHAQEDSRQQLAASRSSGKTGGCMKRCLSCQPCSTWMTYPTSGQQLNNIWMSWWWHLSWQTLRH